MESEGLVCGGEEAAAGWVAAGASELTQRLPGRLGRRGSGWDRALGNGKVRHPGAPSRGYALRSEMILSLFATVGSGEAGCVYVQMII